MQTAHYCTLFLFAMQFKALHAQAAHTTVALATAHIYKAITHSNHNMRDTDTEF